MDHLYCDYDENLSHNEFFRLLQTEHKIICDTAPLENWVICVPRAATITAAQLTNPDFLLAHVLVPHDELPQTHFTNLLGVDIRLERKRLTNSTSTKKGLLSSSSTTSIATVPSSAVSSTSSTSSTCEDNSTINDGRIDSYVLFEEVYYTLQLMKYKVWCIDTALLPASQKNSSSSHAGSASNGTDDDSRATGANSPQPAGIYLVRNVKDAVDIIWNETRSNVIFRRIDQTCATFCQRPTRGTRPLPPVITSYCSGSSSRIGNSSSFDTIESTPHSSDGDGSDDTTVESLASLYAATEALYDQCLCILMQNRRLKEKCRQDVQIYRIVRIALETYMMNVVAERVLDGIGLALQSEAESFNRTVRALADCTGAFCGLSALHTDVVANVRTELLRMEEYSTTIEKIACLRRSINATSSQGVRTVSVDDLIPILAFVIIKSGLTHWTATQKFIQMFVFNDLTDAGIDKNGADSFLAATLEAALTYIGGLSEHKRSAEIAATFAEARSPQRSKFSNQSEFVEYFFEAVRRSDDREVLRLFGTNVIRASAWITADATQADEELVHDNGDVYLPATDESAILIVDTVAETAKLCHPLCVCTRCASIAKARQLNVNTCNEHGIGAVHVAAKFGLAKMINVLLALGADVSLADENDWTALHYAAQRGHQSAVLLLLHAGADVNARSAVDLCTPLHLASLNGHVGCVKAILYAAEQRRIRVEKNCLNRAGDTAVHLAARWGFADIVETLLEYGVKVDTPNREGRTASESAHTSRLRDLLQNTFVMVDVGVGSATGDWDEVDVSGTRVVDAPFRGCISEQMMLGEGGLDGRRGSENDKVIAAIRNGDTKLANYFLGRSAEEAEAVGAEHTLENGHQTDDGTCHPLCTCSKCAALKGHLNATTQPHKMANINGQNAEGITMLLAAASQPGNADLVHYLLEHKASLRCRTPTLQSALHLAVLSGDCGNAEQLLRVAGEYELNVQDADGNTALHLAVRAGNESMVDLLLRHEPWLDARNNGRQTAADIARDGFLFNIGQMLATTAGEQESRGANV